MNRLTGEILDINQVTRPQRQEMFTLYNSYFPRVHVEDFEKDFKEKNWVIVMREKKSGAIRGFSTQMTVKTKISDKVYHALFSGDTIIDKKFWGEKILMALWGRLAFQLIEEYQGHELYWFFICMGHKTYRFLPVFFHEFYPRYDRNTPVDLKKILDGFADIKFHDSYNQANGIVSLGKQSALRNGVADIEEKKLKDPHIKFFATHNPGYTSGDELACIIPLKPENFNRYAKRIVESAMSY